jgi:GPH family glycoside/pentoside/hexuronide:cation symporter
MNPRWPWLSIIPGIIMNLGLQSGNLMFASMTADVCDEDELVTGLRREGAYSAVAGLLHRVTQIVLLMFSGFMPFLAGYTLMTTPPTTAQLLNMKWLLIGSQTFFCILAFILIAFYPLTRTRSEETRRLLDERKRNATP